MAEVKKIATRESYGNALKELAAGGADNLVVLDADLAGATKTRIFKKAYPDRHFNCGIAEADMMSVAAGLSTMGLVPFASSFAMFAAGRAFEQVRNSVGYPHLNVKIGATHGGISVGEDGASHQCCEDFALMRSIPGMTVTLLNIKQHHTINQIALRHSADVGHRILAGKQQYIVAAVLRLPCGLQKVSVVFGLINIAADRRTERKNMITHATHFAGAGIRRIAEPFNGGHHLVGGFGGNGTLARKRVRNGANRHSSLLGHVFDTRHLPPPSALQVARATHCRCRNPHLSFNETIRQVSRNLSHGSCSTNLSNRFVETFH